MAEKNEIKKALLKLDITNNEHWTENGQPRLEAVGIKGLTRADLNKAAPYFGRAHPTFEMPAAEDEPEEVAPQPEAPVQGFSMESSEFGEDAEPRDHQEPAPLPANYETRHEELAALQAQHSRVLARKREVDALDADLRARIEKCVHSMGLEVPSRVNQQRIMNFLSAVQPKPVENPPAGPTMSPLDKSFQPQAAYTQRPQHTPRIPQ